jgi:hypothetical protein
MLKDALVERNMIRAARLCAAIGRDCTILQGVVLGASGKDGGDRHPKVEQCRVTLSDPR